MMKARQYNRSIIKSGEVQPNLANFADVMGVDTGLISGKLREFAEQFTYADTYGSLMEIAAPSGLDEAVSEFNVSFGMSRKQLDMMMIYKILSQKYDVVCTNPPYMGGSNMNVNLSEFVKKNFADYKSDLFSAFVVRCTQLAKPVGYTGFLTPYVWMFIQSYEKMRSYIYNSRTIETLIQFEYSAFEEATVPICTFVLKNSYVRKNGCYFRLTDFRGGMEVQRQKTLEAIADHKCGFYYEANSANFSKIPGMPVAYWVSENFVRAFERGISIDDISDFTGSQHITANNDKYLRFHWEVDNDDVGVGKKWVYYAKGGDFRKWYGNIELVVNWSEGAIQFYRTNSTSNLLAGRYRFKEGITYTELTSSINTFRYLPPVCIFDKKGPSIISVKKLWYCLGIFGTKIAPLYFAILNPTLSTQVRDVKNFPIIVESEIEPQIDEIVKENVGFCKDDWDSFETSWDFERHPLV